MSDAQSKNKMAFGSAIGDQNLIAKLQGARIGIWTGEGISPSGLLLIEALGEVLGRLWQVVDVEGSYSDLFITTANRAARSGMQTHSYQKKWEPPYDFILSIGTNFPSGNGPGLRIGAAGWTAMAGPEAYVGEDDNPVGPAAAAAIASIEVFKSIFAVELGGRIIPLPSEFRWNLWTYGNGDFSPEIRSLNFDDLHIFGVGAVSHSMLWLLERWPSEVSGSIHLIDHDKYDHSNGQRYVGMVAEDDNEQKTDSVASRLQSRHINLSIQKHHEDMNRFFQNKRPDCNVRLAVVGVDSTEHRRHLALKLPLRVVNMWTDGDRVGAARFGYSDDWPCLFCVYPENTKVEMDETGQISRETGLPPAKVRELLFSGAGLNPEEVRKICESRQIDFSQNMIGKPLRSIRGNLCATGRIPVGEGNKEVDVPFVFSSLLSGIGGFVELLHEIWGHSSDPYHWQLRIFAYPAPGNQTTRKADKACYLCSDKGVIDILKQKYS